MTDTKGLSELLDKIGREVSSAQETRDGAIIARYARFTYVSSRLFKAIEDCILESGDRVFPLPVLVMETSWNRNRFKVQRDVLRFFRERGLE